MKPAEFWILTPFEMWEFVGAFKRESHRMSLWTAWHVAAYSRQKKLPDLTALLNRFDSGHTVRRQNIKEMRFNVLAWNEALGGRDLRKRKNG